VTKVEQGRRQAKQLAGSYGATAVSTASPGVLVLMLFDGALRFISRAEYGFGLESLARRNEEIHNNVVKAQLILRELQASLDLEVEGELPQQMYALYDFMISQLLAANVRKDVEPLRAIQPMLVDLRDAWDEMLRKQKKQVS
jgi:flagellar protein FliS